MKSSEKLFSSSFHLYRRSVPAGIKEKCREKGKNYLILTPISLFKKNTNTYFVSRLCWNAFIQRMMDEGSRRTTQQPRFTRKENLFITKLQLLQLYRLTVNDSSLQELWSCFVSSLQENVLSPRRDQKGGNSGQYHGRGAMCEEHNAL